MFFVDRPHASQKLLDLLQKKEKSFSITHPVVIAIARGGIPIGKTIAQGFNAPLYVLGVRKLVVPGQRELGFGSVASGQVELLNQQMIDLLEISPKQIEEGLANAKRELTLMMYNLDSYLPPKDLSNNTVILVDDGMATGLTIKAALKSLASTNPQAIVVSTPVASQSAYRLIEPLVSNIVSVKVPQDFRSLKMWYGFFPRITDEEAYRIITQYGKNHALQYKQSYRGKANQESPPAFAG